jgi:hypothetical protein
MSDFSEPCHPAQELHLDNLAPELREALHASARENGRSLHEEAEHIIRTHLAGRTRDD